MVEIVVVWAFFVETAGKTLEEMGEIFAAPNPRKASTKKTKVATNESGEVTAVDSHVV